MFGMRDRGGTRGGQDQFNWADVKDDKHRENYLGHSLNAPVGRWQNKKDLQWFSKGKNDGKVTGKDELKRRQEMVLIKQQEQEAMAMMLRGEQIPNRVSLSEKELSPLLRKGHDEEDDTFANDRIKGLGFKGVNLNVSKEEATHERLEGTGEESNAVVSTQEIGQSPITTNKKGRKEKKKKDRKEKKLAKAERRDKKQRKRKADDDEDSDHPIGEWAERTVSRIKSIKSLRRGGNDTPPEHNNRHLGRSSRETHSSHQVTVNRSMTQERISDLRNAPPKKIVPSDIDVSDIVSTHKGRLNNRSRSRERDRAGERRRTHEKLVEKTLPKERSDERDYVETRRTNRSRSRSPSRSRLSEVNSKRKRNGQHSERERDGKHKRRDKYYDNRDERYNRRSRSRSLD
eukprot:CFRG0321T1